MHVFFRVAPVGEAFRQVRNSQGDEVFFSLYNTGGVSDHHPRLPAGQIDFGEMLNDYSPGMEKAYKIAQMNILYQKITPNLHILRHISICVETA